MDKESLDKIVEKLTYDYNEFKERYEEEFQKMQHAGIDSDRHARLAFNQYTKLTYISDLMSYINSTLGANYQLPPLPSTKSMPL
ncbi:MAG: hypothetical protein AABY15_09715 [Nanoarchaeota archaeon]